MSYAEKLPYVRTIFRTQWCLNIDSLRTYVCNGRVLSGIASRRSITRCHIDATNVSKWHVPVERPVYKTAVHLMHGHPQ